MKDDPYLHTHTPALSLLFDFRGTEVELEEKEGGQKFKRSVRVYWGHSNDNSQRSHKVSRWIENSTHTHDL